MNVYLTYMGIKVTFFGQVEGGVVALVNRFNGLYTELSKIVALVSKTRAGSSRLGRVGVYLGQDQAIQAPTKLDWQVCLIKIFGIESLRDCKNNGRVVFM